jgi:Bacterial Ig domain/Bacterial Ig-like domain
MRRIAIPVTAFAATVLLGGSAYAYWTGSDSSAPAAAVADSVPVGNRPLGTFAAPSTVAVGFGRATTTSNRLVTEYVVRRYATVAATTPAATFTCQWPAPGALSCVDSGVPAGAWYYSDQARLAGSTWVGAESARSTVVYADSTAPTVTVTAVTPTPGATGYNTASPVTVSLAASDAGSGVASITYTVDSGSPVTVAATTANVTVTGEGTHTVSYRATDNAGNDSATGSQVVRIDTVAPNAPAVTSYAAVVNQANQTAVTVSGTAEAGATVTVQTTDGTRTVTRTTTAAADGTWSVTGLDLSTLADGPISYRVLGTDAAGNTGAATTVTGSKDTVAPALAITALTDPVTAANVTAVTAAGTAESGATVTVTITDGTRTLTPAVTGSASWSIAATAASTLADGTLTWTVTATDAAGNQTSIARTGSKDTTAPTASFVVGPGNGSAGAIRSGGPYYVYANASDAAPGTLASLRADVSALTAGQTAISLTGTGGPWPVRGTTYAYRSAAQTAGTLTAGTKSVTVTATDAVGNTAVVTGTVTADATAPTPVSFTTTNIGTAGKPEAGDTFAMRWSEEMDPATLYPGWAVGSTADVAGTVTLTDATSGNGTNKNEDTLVVTGPTGIRLGAVSNLDGRIVPTQRGTVVFAATIRYSLAGGQSVVTVTLGALTSGTPGTVPANGTSTGTWTPTATNTDLVGNAITGTTTVPAVPF